MEAYQQPAMALEEPLDRAMHVVARSTRQSRRSTRRPVVRA